MGKKNTDKENRRWIRSQEFFQWNRMWKATRDGDETFWAWHKKFMKNHLKYFDRYWK